MPRKNQSEEVSKAAEPKIPKELLDQLITGPINQSEFETIYHVLKKDIVERAMSAEVSQHLGYNHGDAKPAGQSNQRNGTSGKTVITDDGSIDIEVPHDREGRFEPLIIGKHERRFTGFGQLVVRAGGRKRSHRSRCGSGRRHGDPCSQRSRRPKQ